LNSLQERFHTYALLQIICNKYNRQYLPLYVTLVSYLGELNNLSKNPSAVKKINLL